MTPPRDRYSLIRLPLLPLAAGFALGVALGYGVAIPFGLAMCAACVCLVGAVLARWMWKWPTLGYCLLTATILCAGVLRVSLGVRSVPGDSLTRSVGDARELAQVRGEIVSFATMWTETVYGGETRTRMRFAMDASEVRTPTGWIPASGRVQVDVVDPLARPVVGATMEARGWLSRFRPSPNPGMSDPRQRAARRGCWLKLWCDSGELLAIQSTGESPLARWTSRLRASAWNQPRWEGTESNSLLAAMVLGRRDSTLHSLDDSMRRCGLGHYLSISGLHLGLFVAMIYGLCRLGMVSRRQAAAVVLVALAGYLLVAQPRPALLRSAIMASVAAVALLTGRLSSTLNALSLALLGMLCVAPSLIAQAGFQLSFVIVLGLIVCSPRVHALLFGRWLLIRSLVVYRGERAWVRWVRRRLETTLAWTVSGAVVAWGVAFPLAAYHFGLVSIWGALLSVLVLPLVVLILALGYLSLGLSWLAPNLAAELGDWGAGVCGWLAEWVRGFETIPGVGIELRPVSVTWVLAMYAALGASLWLRRSVRRVGLAVVTCALAVGLTYATQRAATPDGVQLDVLSVGAGQCMILTGEGIDPTWFDAGSRSYAQPWQSVTRPFLRSRCIDEPTRAVLSHADGDHYNMLYDAPPRGQLQTVILGGGFPQVPGDSPAGRFVALLAKRNISMTRPRAGDKIDLGGGAVYRILLAGVPSSNEPNDQSLVGILETPHGRILMTGDIERDGIKALLASGEDLRADVIVLPHHGAWTAPLPELLEAVAPKIVLCSSRRVPDGGAKATQAADEFYRALAKRYEFHCTAREGYLQVSLCDGRIRVTPHHESAR
ncbi:MAG: DUF4131 domain-containing protein [Phycisphaerales bacterium]|jgi:competence protein ComEC|nr:DUF4131 domain-containing protein [Phycisphaerales bacterium]